MSKKYYYYVGVITENNEMCFVTKVDHANHNYWYDTNETPMAMAKSVAEDLAEGIVLNNRPAVVVKSLLQLTGHPVGDKQEEPREKAMFKEIIQISTNENGDRFVQFVGFGYSIIEVDPKDKTRHGFVEYDQNAMPMAEFTDSSFKGYRNAGHGGHFSGYDFPSLTKLYKEKFGKDGKAPVSITKATAPLVPDGYYLWDSSKAE